MAAMALPIRELVPACSMRPRMPKNPLEDGRRKGAGTNLSLRAVVYTKQLWHSMGRCRFATYPGWALQDKDFSRCDADAFEILRVT